MHSDTHTQWCTGTHTHMHHSHHRLQLSRNLRDSPGFIASVPGHGRPYHCSIVCPGHNAMYGHTHCTGIWVAGVCTPVYAMPSLIGSHFRLRGVYCTYGSTTCGKNGYTKFYNYYQILLRVLALGYLFSLVLVDRKSPFSVSLRPLNSPITSVAH